MMTCRLLPSGLDETSVELIFPSDLPEGMIAFQNGQTAFQMPPDYMNWMEMSFPSSNCEFP